MEFHARVHRRRLVGRHERLVMKRTIAILLLPSLLLAACTRGADPTLHTGTDCAESDCIARVLTELDEGDRIQLKAGHGEFFGAELVSFKASELVVRDKWYGPGLSEGEPSQRGRTHYELSELVHLEVLSEDPTGVEARKGTVGLLVISVITLGLLSAAAASLWF